MRRFFACGAPLLFFLGDRVIKNAAVLSSHFFIFNDILVNSRFFFFPQNILFIMIVGVGMFSACGIVLLHAWRQQTIILICGVASIFLGALSNSIDRIRWGGVIDYISISGFTVFNIADILIGIGVACLFVYFIKMKYRDQLLASEK